MSVVLKRSEGHIPLECKWGCCTILYDPVVPKIRRATKRSERQAWRRQVIRDMDDDFNAIMDEMIYFESFDDMW